MSTNKGEESGVPDSVNTDHAEILQTIPDSWMLR